MYSKKKGPAEQIFSLYLQNTNADVEFQKGNGGIIAVVRVYESNTDNLLTCPSSHGFSPGLRPAI